MPPLPEPLAGEVWDARLGEGQSPEQSGTRPVIVVSADSFNASSNYLVFIVPVTSTRRPIPYQIILGKRQGGLSPDSIVMCEQVRALSVRRFVHRRGTVDRSTLIRVRGMIVRLLEDEDDRHP